MEMGMGDRPSGNATLESVNTGLKFPGTIGEYTTGDNKRSILAALYFP